MNTIGSRIAYFRKQKQMTQEELAERLSVTAQAVSKWECDTSYPDILGIQALAKELGVTVDELFGEERKIPEVKEAVVSYTEGTAIVKLNEQLADEVLRQTIEEQDYKVISIQ